MRSKKLMIAFSTGLILSTSAAPVFARDLPYNSSYNFSQTYNSYGNNKSYKNNNGNGRNGYGNNNYNNIGTNIINILQSLNSTTTNSDLNSTIEAQYTAISTAEQSNLQISKQINSKESQIRNLAMQVKRGTVTYASAQMAEVTTLSTTLQTDMQAVTAANRKVQSDEAAVKHIGRNRYSQTTLTDLTTEETDLQVLGTALTKVSSDLDSILTVLQGQLVTTPTTLAVQPVTTSAVQSVIAVNGTITVTLNGTLTTTPAVTDFAVTQIIGSNVTTIIPTAVTMTSANTVTLTVPTVASTSIAQYVVDSVSYENTTPVYTTFEVAANSAVSLASAVQSVNAYNGSLTVTLNGALTAVPTVTDFTVTQTIGSAVTAVVPTAVTMTSSNTVTLTVPTVASTSTAQYVVDSVSYKNTTPVCANAFYVAANSVTTPTTFYGTFNTGLLSGTSLLGNYDTITVTNGALVTGVTVNGYQQASGTEYSVNGNTITVAVSAKTDTVVIQTTGGINNPVTIY